MQKARIIWVEDFLPIVEAWKFGLGRAGHEVVFHCQDLESAIEIVKSGKLEQEGISLAIVDGYFPESSTGFGERYFGPKAAQAIRETGLPIKIIAYSSDPGCDYGDVFVRKGGGAVDLLETISEL